MFNHQHNSLNVFKKHAFDSLVRVTEKGHEILRNNYFDESLLKSWQDYSKSALEAIDLSYGLNTYVEYSNYILNLFTLSPQERLKRSIEKLAEFSQKISQLPAK